MPNAGQPTAGQTRSQAFLQGCRVSKKAKLASVWCSIVQLRLVFRRPMVGLVTCTRALRMRWCPRRASSALTSLWPPQASPASCSPSCRGAPVIRLQARPCARARVGPLQVHAAASTDEAQAEGWTAVQPQRLRLDNLTPQPGARKKDTRKGRGYGAGQVGPTLACLSAWTTCGCQTLQLCPAQQLQNARVCAPGSQAGSVGAGPVMRTVAIIDTGITISLCTCRAAAAALACAGRSRGRARARAAGQGLRGGRRPSTGRCPSCAALQAVRRLPALLCMRFLRPICCGVRLAGIMLAACRRDIAVHAADGRSIVRWIATL